MSTGGIQAVEVSAGLLRNVQMKMCQRHLLPMHGTVDQAQR